MATAPRVARARTGTGGPASGARDAASLAGGEPPVKQSAEAAASGAGVNISPTAEDLIAEARAARAPDPLEERLYTVLSPLRHDGRRYSPDDPQANTITLTKDEAKELVNIGVPLDPETGASENG